MHFSSENDNSPFASYGNFQHQEFRKRKRNFIIWSVCYWTALTIQNCFQIAQKISDKEPVILEILIFVLFAVTWCCFRILIVKACNSYRWYRIYEVLVTLGTMFLSPLGLAYGATNSSIYDKMRYQIETSLSILSFFFLTQKGTSRALCYTSFMAACSVYILAISDDYSAEKIVRTILFFIAVSISFAVLNFTVEKGNRALYHELNQIREQDKIWKLLLEGLPDGMAIISTDFKIIYGNASFKEFLKLVSPGRSDLEQDDILENFELKIREQVDPENLIGLKSLRSVSEITFNLKNFLTSAQVPVIDLFSSSSTAQTSNYAVADCKIQNREIEIKAAKANFKETTYYIVLMADTTQRGLLARLEDSNGFKDSLLKSISHELRGPLNGSMLAVVQVLKSNMDPASNEVLKFALLCQQRLLIMINGILDLAKINSGTLQLQIETVDIKSIIQKVIDIFKMPISQKKIDLRIDADFENCSKLTTDAERVEQIFFHFMDNALKFTEKGSITVNISQPLDDPDSISLSVEDTGIGMNAEEVDRILRLYHSFSLHRKVNENSTGMGYGLTLTTSLLKELGHDFDVTSEVGVGSKFSCKLKDFGPFSFHNISLKRGSIVNAIDRRFSHNLKIDSPNVQSSRDFSANSSFAMLQFDEGIDVQLKEFPSKMQLLSSRLLLKGLPSRSTKSKHSSADSKNFVLVVDDDLFNVFALTKILQQLGYHVLSAYNGRDAIKVTQENHQSLLVIFMDLNMPIMNGYEATTKLKELMDVGDLTKVPIIAATAYAQEVERNKTCIYGFDGFLTKPLDVEKIQAILEKCTNR